MTDVIILTLRCIQCGQLGDLPLAVADPCDIVHECSTGLWVSWRPEVSSVSPSSLSEGS